MHLISGTFVGPYRVLSALGAGGMGEVYRARDEKLSRDVALKVLTAELAASSDHLRRFEQEARAASALNHPNIIAIYDIGRHDGLAYIAMELVDGSDLRSVAAGGALQPKQLLRVAVKVADGLAAAHERGIVHRDLKPENVMVSREGFVKILDFGLAKLAVPFSESESTVPHTTPGAVFGTVGYMSPEQAAGRPADFRSDQFALGVMLYEMITGRLPFSEPSAAETLAAIIRRDPDPIDDTSVPFELIRIMERCLAKDPADRYASTRDLARDLREIRDRVSHPSEPRQRSEKTVRPQRRRAPVWIAAAAATVMVGAGALVMYQRHTPLPKDAGLTSMAVLPFTDLTGSADGQVFADGLSHMISGRVAESRAVRVVEPVDPVAQNVDPAVYGRRTGARYVVRGAVQREQENVRINYSLIDAASGDAIATETLTGDAGDVFKLEDAVADRILHAVDATAPDKPKRHNAPDLGSADQKAYVEAVGLLLRSKDEKSVDRAIKLLEGVLENARDSAAVNAHLGRALLYKSRLSHRPSLIEQATVYGERAADLDGSLADVRVTLGLLRTASGKPKEAAAEFERALAVRPDLPQAVLGLADASNAMGRAADAERYYRKAISLQPDWPSPYNSYGLFCYSRGRYAEAVRYLSRFAELMPDSPRTYVNLGAAYQALGRYDDALRSYQRSIAMAPNPGGYTNVSLVQMILGHYDEACQAGEKAAELAPGDYVVWANLADCYRAAGRRDQASAAYEKSINAARDALGINPTDALAHAITASSLAKTGHQPQAADRIATALKLDPTNANVLYNAAIVAMLRGSTDVAISWLERAVSAGYPAGDLQHDADFASVRSNPEFVRLVAPHK